MKGSEAFIPIMHRCAHSAKLRRRTLSPLPKDQFLWPSFDDALCRYFQALCRSVPIPAKEAVPSSPLCLSHERHCTLNTCHPNKSTLSISSVSQYPHFLVQPHDFYRGISKAMVSAVAPGGLRQAQSCRDPSSQALRTTDDRWERWDEHGEIPWKGS